jgi:hypothetical protein
MWLSQRVGASRIMIASFGTLTLSGEVDVPKLAIMTGVYTRSIPVIETANPNQQHTKAIQ